MALIYNCNEDIAAIAFISELQAIHSFYKHLVKHEVIKIGDILFRVQKYIQIKDATRSATNRSTKKGDEGQKLKPELAAPKKSQN